MLTISHSYAEGTILDGTTRGDAPTIKPVMRTHRWKWSGRLGAWFQQQSRDQQPRMSRINGTAEQLRALGYDVTVEVDRTPRAMAEREADLGERMDARVERFERRADRLHSDGQARKDRADQFFQQIPFGQPVMGVADRNRREKQLTRFLRGVEITQQGDQAAERAATASKHMDRRYGPRAVKSRIERLETEQRKLQRYLNEGTWSPHLDDNGNRRNRRPITDPAHREQLTVQLTDVEQQLQHWRDMHQQHVAEGRARHEYGPDDIEKGQHVRIDRWWRKVKRVNAKTVSVIDVETTKYWGDGKERTYTVPYRYVADVRWLPETETTA